MIGQVTANVRQGHRQGCSILRLVLLAALTGPVVTANADSALPTGWVRLFQQLASLRGTHSGKVRILHLGDSHVASDSLSAPIRAFLQEALGDGGPGFGVPWAMPAYSKQNGFASGCTSGWRRVPPAAAGPDGFAGFLGCYAETSTAGQRAWLEGEGADFSLYFARQPGGGSFELRRDGASIQTVRTSAGSWTFGSIRSTAAGAGRHRWEVVVRGDGRIRLLGATVESGRPGVVYSAIGVIGARADSLLKCGDEAFCGLLASLEPDLVILGFGTNEAAQSDFDPIAYEKLLAGFLGRIRHGAPGAAVLVLGPPDRDENLAGSWRTSSRLAAVRSAQWQASGAGGAMFFDAFKSMGGAGSADEWARGGLAQPDRTHLTAAGYAKLGYMVLGGILSRCSQEGGSMPGRLLARLHQLPDSTLLPSAGVSMVVVAGAPEPPQDEVFSFRDANGMWTITNDPSYRAPGTAQKTGADAARRGSPGGE